VQRSAITRRATSIAFVLLLAACGGGGGSAASGSSTSLGAGTSVQASISGPARTYVKAVCGAMITWRDSIKRRTTDLTTKIAGITDLSTGRQLLVEYLRDIAADTHAMAQAVNAAGTPPVENGDKARSQLVNSLTKLEDGFTKAATKAQGLPTDDAAAFQKAAAKLSASISSASGVVSGVGNTPVPVLDVAFQAEPTCVSLKSG
jgi:hypothetical protein